MRNTTSSLTVWSILLYVDGDVGVYWKFIYMMLVDIHLRIADRRHPHVFSVKEKDVGHLFARTIPRMGCVLKIFTFPMPFDSEHPFRFGYKGTKNP